MTTLLPYVLGFLALVGPITTYMLARRKGSGTIRTSEASEVYDAMKEYQTRMAAEMDKIRDHTQQLDKDFITERTLRLEEQRKRIECEARITVLESNDAAAAIVEEAKKEAALIRFNAAQAAEVLQQAADKAAGVVKQDAADAKQAKDDETS